MGCGGVGEYRVRWGGGFSEVDWGNMGWGEMGG